MVKLRLYGKLRKFGELNELSVNSIPELIRAMCVLHPEFKKVLKVGSYHVYVNGIDLSEGQVNTMIPHDAEVKIVPVIMGSKEGGIFQIIAGAVLIVASMFIPGLAAIAPMLFNMGMAMVMGGIAQLLAPQPSEPLDVKRADNKSFSSIANTAAQGTCVPIVYGKMLVGSKVMSAGLASGNGSDFDLTDTILGTT